MSLYIRLLKLQLRQRFNPSALRAELAEGRAKALRKLLVAGVAILSVGLLLGFYTWVLVQLLPAFQSLGLEQVFLGMVLLAAMVLVFIFGLFYLLGLLFFSKDTEFLAALPIPQRTVFLVKFSQVLGGEIATTALLLVPALAVYGLSVGGGAFYWVMALCTLVMAPCIPLALSGLVALLLMRFNALWRRRDLLTTVGALAALLAYIVGWSYLSSRMNEMMSLEAAMGMIQNNAALLRTIVSAFPPAGWAAEALRGQIGYVLQFAGASLLALTLVSAVAGKIYYAGAMAQTEGAANTRKVKLGTGTVRRHGALRALFAREWKSVLRTPTYALNSLAMIFMGPLMLLLPFLMQGMGEDPEFQALIASLRNTADPRVVLLVLSAFSLAMGVANPGAFTGFSREGKLFYWLRVYPVSPGKQILAKFLFGYTCAMLCVILTCIAGTLLLNIAPAVAIGAALLSAVGAVCPLALSMIPDLLRPKLNWNSETEAMKQNMNAMLGMLIGWVALAAAGFGAYTLARTGLGVWPLTLLIAAIMAGLGGASLALLGRVARRALVVLEG